MREISRYQKSDNWCRAKSLGCGPSAVGSDCSGKASELSYGARNILLIDSADNTVDATH
jgi:hypothetical protein